MRRKRGNTNIRILQSQLQNLAVKEKEANQSQKAVLEGSGVPITPFIELPITVKLPKKTGVPKNELINTRRLLTM